MSVDYASGLSHYDDLGVCGLDEVFDEPPELDAKVDSLARLVSDMRGSCVVHAGAGLSTAAGIRDFRGKGGVWTELMLESRARKGSRSVRPGEATEDVKSESKNEEQHQVPGAMEGKVRVKPFDETIPTFSHMALKALCEAGFVRHIVSQNVDGLFLKANLNRSFVSELHGNFYLDECTRCRARFVRATASSTMRLQKSTTRCSRNQIKPTNKPCSGFMRDTILDWESPIPYNELRRAEGESNRGKLHICIGTSLQLKPSMDLVRKRNDKSRKLVIINLQPTQFDSHADLVINYYADEVMERLCKRLHVQVDAYQPKLDPTKDPDRCGKEWSR